MNTWIPDARNFPYLNSKQVEALPKDKMLLVLPTAAIEQHGHHLPLATDTLINNALLGRALALLPPELPIYALPPVCYGKSNEHIGFPGTMAMSAATYMSVLHDIGASVAAAGFKKLVLYNSHGGNSALNDVMARDLRAEFGLRTFHMGASAGAKAEGLNAQEVKYGFRAGEWETHPGRIAQDIVVDLPYPRTADVRESEAFDELVNRTSKLLRETHRV